MDPLEQYYTQVSAILDHIAAEEDSIDAAATLVADTVAAGRVVFVGTGGAHGCMGIEELFYRAGGLACISPMLDGGVYLMYGALRTTKMERLHEYGRVVVDLYGVSEGDLVIVAAPVGITPMCIDEALEAKERGATVIGIATTSFAENVPHGHPARHPSNKSLDQIADVFVNCHVPFGDAVVEVPGVSQKFGPTSSIALAFTENAIVARAIELLVERGIEPPVWQSANTTGGDEANRAHIEHYQTRVRHL